MLGILFRSAEEQTNLTTRNGTTFTFNNSFWICFITMSSVGYGEYSPVTSIGKVVAIIGAFLGVVSDKMIIFIVHHSSGHGH